MPTEIGMKRFIAARAEIARRLPMLAAVSRPLAVCMIVHAVSRTHGLSPRQASTLRLMYLTLPE